MSPPEPPEAPNNSMLTVAMASAISNVLPSDSRRMPFERTLHQTGRRCPSGVPKLFHKRSNLLRHRRRQLQVRLQGLVAPRVPERSGFALFAWRSDQLAWKSASLPVFPAANQISNALSPSAPSIVSRSFRWHRWHHPAILANAVRSIGTVCAVRLALRPTRLARKSASLPVFPAANQISYALNPSAPSVRLCRSFR